MSILDDYSPEDRARVEAWLADNPPEVRELYEEFPPGSILVIDGINHYVIGFADPLCENGHWFLRLSKTNPVENYELAQFNAEHHCVHCIRENVITVQ